MQMWRRSRLGNPATWYLGAGLALLGATMWVPWFTAQRTARVERRADELAGCLLAAALEPVDVLDAVAAEVVAARGLRFALAAGVHVTDVERIDPPPPGALLALRNKHYAFHLATSPLPDSVLAGRDTSPSLEVMAWPLGRAGPGHCVFFHPDDAPRAYTRNLTANYAGLGSRRPRPGQAHRRPHGLHEVTSYYRGFDDERWILY